VHEHIVAAICGRCETKTALWFEPFQSALNFTFRTIRNIRLCGLRRAATRAAITTTVTAEITAWAAIAAITKISAWAAVITAAGPAATFASGVRVSDRMDFNHVHHLFPALGVADFNGQLRAGIQCGVTRTRYRRRMEENIAVRTCLTNETKALDRIKPFQGNLYNFACAWGSGETICKTIQLSNHLLNVKTGEIARHKLYARNRIIAKAFLKKCNRISV
jgi:hypothetical protein